MLIRCYTRRSIVAGAVVGQQVSGQPVLTLVLPPCSQCRRQQVSTSQMNEAEILTIKILAKMSLFFCHAGLHPVSHLQGLLSCHPRNRLMGDSLRGIFYGVQLATIFEREMALPQPPLSCDWILTGERMGILVKPLTFMEIFKLTDLNHSAGPGSSFLFHSTCSVAHFHYQQYLP